MNRWTWLLRNNWAWVVGIKHILFYASYISVELYARDENINSSEKKETELMRRFNKLIIKEKQLYTLLCSFQYLPFSFDFIRKRPISLMPKCFEWFYHQQNIRSDYFNNCHSFIALRILLQQFFFYCMIKIQYESMLHANASNI